jgi:hypothetical protein
VRSHAKASLVGSNSDRGASRRPLRRPGAFAALLVALMAAACFLPGAASAIEFRSLTGSFGPDGTSGTGFSEYLGPLAFDQSNKRLYALDQAEQKIHAYDASAPGTHTPVGGAFPIGAPGAGEENDIAVNSVSHNLYFANGSGRKVYGFDESGSPLSGFPLTGHNGTNFEARICGVAVDPTGKLWVSEGSGFISRFGSQGDFEPYSFSGGHCRIALDSHENLFVAAPFGGVTEYTAESGYLESSAKSIDSGSSYGLTVDRSTDEIYVVHSGSIAVYDDEGNLLYEFGEGVPGAEYYGELGGIAIDEASEEVYVSDYGHRKIDVFGPPISLPKLVITPASGIGASEATVNGTINPRGIAVEGCHFEVIPADQFIESKYESVTEAEKYPCAQAPGSIPIDSEPHAVSAEVGGLNPASVYHYRLVASNEVGEASSADARFTSGPAPPQVEAVSVEAVDNTAATVTAKINPRGGATTYHLEYGTTSAYGQSTTESSPFGFASDTSRHTVSVHIAGLQPGTAYHFRFVATNEVDTTDGEDTTFATYPMTSGFAPCPNDQFRTGAGARLSDCRAYEQASPIDKHGAGAQGEYGQLAASSSGDRVTFFATGGLPTTGGSSRLIPYVATRGSDGWSSDGFLPLGKPRFYADILGANEDLSAALVVGEGPGGVGGQLFVRDSETATFEPGPAAPGEQLSGGRASLVGFAADPRHLAFIGTSQLMPSALSGRENLYDLDHGALTLADRIPAGSAVSCDDEAGPACEVPAGGVSTSSKQSEISSDGERVFFTTDPTNQTFFENGRIYMRENGVRTTWISASQRTTPDPGGEKPATFVGITPDGSKAFFLSCEKLTDDSTAVSTAANSCKSNPSTDVQGEDLYSYDTGTGELTDLSVDSNAGDPLGAEVQGVVGISDDGSYVYFAAPGVLAPDASRGGCPVYQEPCNLYVYHDGVTKLVAKLFGSEPDSKNWTGRNARVSADGQVLSFVSVESLTGYDNSGTGCFGGRLSEHRCGEYFRYSAPEEKLTCLTCLPTGVPPSRSPSLGGEAGGHYFGNGFPSDTPRNLSANGNRFFFNSPDAMVPGDTNNVTDAYEWEAKGEGSCESESQNGGCIYLISSGTDPQPSGFLDASRNGDHAFILTEQLLVPTDQDQLYDVYDAGVGAGLPSQHTLSPPSCTSTACQSNPAPPPDQTPASATFHGPGNVKSPAKSKGRKCPKGKRNVRRAGKVRCLPRHGQKKRHKRANVNRGGSK